MAAHARLGPSNHRWPNCPGSVREEAQYEDVPGAPAIDGTGSHELLELCLNNNVNASSYDMQIIAVNHSDMPGGWLVDLERCTRVQMCLDYVKRRVKELAEQFPGATITVESESKADPGGYFGRTDWWGTVDITILVRDSHTGECYFVEVCDYKDGKVYVNVEGNTQLYSYLGGKMRPWVGSGPDKVRPFNVNAIKGARISIVQPKSSTPVRYEDVSATQVMDKLASMNKAAYATDDPNAPLKAGKHCQWCKANPKKGGHCTASTEESLQTVKMMSNDITFSGDKNLFEYIGNAVKDPAALSVDELKELADAEDGLLSAFKKIRDEIEKRIAEDIHVPGYAMRPGNAKQVYNQPDEVIAAKLKGRRMKKDQIYPAKLITPAALMKSNDLTKEQKESFKSEYISTLASDKLTLKKVAHEKPAIKSIFDDIPVAQCNTDVLDCNTSETTTASDELTTFF